MESGQGSTPDGEQPAPGWYPDPMDSTGLRYWDGKRWTVEEAPTGSGPSAPPEEAAVQRPPRTLVSVAWPTIGVLALCGLINVALLVAGLQYSDHVNAALTSDGPSLSEADTAKDSLVLINGIFTFSILVAAIVFLIWFHRAYSNAAGLANGRLRWGTGWSVGAWFVPILWWWRPKQIANDVWRAGDPK